MSESQGATGLGGLAIGWREVQWAGNLFWFAAMIRLTGEKVGSDIIPTSCSSLVARDPNTFNRRVVVLALFMGRGQFGSFCCAGVYRVQPGRQGQACIVYVDWRT